MVEYVHYYLMGFNTLGFVLMYIDKQKAIRNKWRVKENTLIFIALIGGSLGLYLGMKLFKHKTRHAKFKLGIPIIIFFQLLLIYLY